MIHINGTNGAHTPLATPPQLSFAVTFGIDMRPVSVPTSKFSIDSWRADDVIVTAATYEIDHCTVCPSLSNQLGDAEPQAIQTLGHFTKLLDKLYSRDDPSEAFLLLDGSDGLEHVERQRRELLRNMLTMTERHIAKWQVKGGRGPEYCTTISLEDRRRSILHAITSGVSFHDPILMESRKHPDMVITESDDFDEPISTQPTFVGEGSGYTNREPPEQAPSEFVHGIEGDGPGGAISEFESVFALVQEPIRQGKVQEIDWPTHEDESQRAVREGSSSSQSTLFLFHDSH